MLSSLVQEFSTASPSPHSLLPSSHVLPVPVSRFLLSCSHQASVSFASHRVLSVVARFGRGYRTSLVLVTKSRGWVLEYLVGSFGGLGSRKDGILRRWSIELGGRGLGARHSWLSLCQRSFYVSLSFLAISYPMMFIISFSSGMVLNIPAIPYRRFHLAVHRTPIHARYVRSLCIRASHSNQIGHQWSRYQAGRLAFRRICGSTWGSIRWCSAGG